MLTERDVIISHCEYNMFRTLNLWYQLFEIYYYYYYEYVQSILFEFFYLLIPNYISFFF